MPTTAPALGMTMPDEVANRNPDFGPGAEVQRLLSAEMAIVHSPQLGAARPDSQVERVRIG